MRRQLGFLALPSVEEAKVIGKVVLVVGFALVCGAAGWKIKATIDEGQIADLERDKTTAIAQGKLLSQSLQSCSDGAAAVKSTADGALKLANDTLAKLAPLLASNRLAVGKLEDILKQPTPTGAGCKEAWAALDQLRKGGTK